MRRRERKREGGREGGREGERERESACLWFHVRPLKSCIFPSRTVPADSAFEGKASTAAETGASGRGDCDGKKPKQRT